jgi:hypothetical protein
MIARSTAWRSLYAHMCTELATAAHPFKGPGGKLFQGLKL